MKKTILLAFVMLSTSVFADEFETTRSNLIRTNPLSLLLNSASVGYERAIDSRNSVGLQFEHARISHDDLNGAVNVLGFTRRYYVSGFDSPSSLYFSLSIGAMEISASNDKDYVVNGDGFFGSGSVGRQSVYDSGIVVSGGFGVSYSNFRTNGKFTKQDENQSDRYNLDSGHSSLTPFLDIAIGYLF